MDYSVNDNMIGDSAHSSMWEGCSAFFMTSSALSYLHGKKNRKVAMEHALQDERFTKRAATAKRT